MYFKLKHNFIHNKIDNLNQALHVPITMFFSDLLSGYVIKSVL